MAQRLPGMLSFDMPTGGMFIWARLPEGQDGTALLTHALAHGWAYVPDEAFYAGQPDKRTLRLKKALADCKAQSTVETPPKETA